MLRNTHPYLFNYITGIKQKQHLILNLIHNIVFNNMHTVALTRFPFWYLGFIFLPVASDAEEILSGPLPLTVPPDEHTAHHSGQPCKAHESWYLLRCPPAPLSSSVGRSLPQSFAHPQRSCK